MSDVAEPISQDDPEAIRRDIAALLDKGELDDATARLREALTRWPQHHGLRMLDAQAQAQSGATETAIEAYLTLGRESPDGFWSLLRAVRHLRDAGQLERARTVFAAEVWPGKAPDEVKLRALAWLATAADESAEAAAFLETLAAAPEGAPVGEALARLAALRARQGHEEAARTALEKASALGALPLRAQAVEADLMLADGRVDALLPLARNLVAEESDKVEHARRLVVALMMAGLAEEAYAALRTALERWPADWILLGRLNTMALPRQALAECVAIVRDRAKPGTLPEISRFQLALALLTLGAIEDASALLAGIAPDGATAPMAVPLRDALAIMPPEAWREASMLADDRVAAVQVVRVPHARTALMVFGSPTGGYTHLPFGLFDAVFAGYPVHRIYLRDDRGRGFLQGMRNFGETDAATVAGLSGILADLGEPALVTMGASIAGHAAARYGLALGARAVALLAAPTSFASDPISGERASPYNRINLLRRLARTMLGDAALGDLLPVFAEGGQTRFFYYYGQATERGERNAARLRDIASVTLRPIADSAHAALPLDLLARPEWTSLLRKDLGLSPRRQRSRGD